MLRFLLISFLLTANSAAARPLSITDITKSVTEHYPVILANYNEIEAARANLTTAQSFQDVTFRQSYKDMVRGFYDGRIYDAVLEKELGVFGAKIYGGYRKSARDFADYDGEIDTNTGGEVRSGIKLSLLQDRDIDQNRLEVILSNIDISESRIELEKLKMQILNDATKAYWSWVASGAILKIYENLYNLSITRQEQLEVRANKGDIADIIVVENRKNLLKRKSLLTRVRQEFELSSVYLALFYRDLQGEMQQISTKHLPDAQFNMPQIPDQETYLKNKEQALILRPEVKLLEADINKKSYELKYAKNLIQPKLDLEVGVSKDLGEGPRSISESNNFINLDFSIPLQQREAKGKITAAKSELSARNYQKDLLQNQIQIEIEQLMTRIEAISEIYNLVVEEVSLAEILQVAEVEKFKNGASNFFLVNVREQELAELQAANIEIFKDLNGALADYQLAIFDTDIMR